MKATLPALGLLLATCIATTPALGNVDPDNGLSVYRASAHLTEDKGFFEHGKATDTLAARKKKKSSWGKKFYNAKRKVKNAARRGKEKASKAYKRTRSTVKREVKNYKRCERNKGRCR